MYERLQNRTTAWSIALVVILLSVWMGGATTLGNMRETAQMGYFVSATGSGKGISYDLDRIAGDSMNLATVAWRYLDMDDDTVVQMVENAGQLSDPYEDMDVRFAVAKELNDDIQALNKRLEREQLTGQDREYQGKLTSNIEGAYHAIRSSRYHDEAAKFNKLLKKRPARYLAAMADIKPLPQF